MTPRAIALNRFGLGARLADRSMGSGDPRDGLQAQLTAPSVPGAFADLPTGAEGATRSITAFAAGAPALEQQLRAEGRAIWDREVSARTRHQIATSDGFRERLVMFWSNHFTVSIQRPILLGVAGAFEREAIRPHVTGRFVDLLMAATRHPAMLLYLDQAQSIGPTSPAGRTRGRGLNENLAREILELHTLGVDAGYTQADVRALAMILTGWSIARPNQPDPGTFRFAAAAHEPGAHSLLGKTYMAEGIAQGEAALADLARHPATVRRLAAKLAQHVVADQPPPSLVARLEAAWRGSDGDLSTVYRALIQAPEAWEPAPVKLKSPHEYLVSVWRLIGVPPRPSNEFAALGQLGQRPFAAGSPAGWPDRAADWLGPEALLRRIEWAHQTAVRRAGDLDVAALTDAAFAADPPDPVRQAVARAPSAVDGLTLLLTAPEFMRR